MDNERKEALLKEARVTLYNNWKEGGFTVPSQRLYPYQWNWDSGFVSIGFSCFDTEHAMQELRSLFSGQWSNGMLPHIIFHGFNETGYFPNPSFWGTSKVAEAAKKVATSGITQPPVHGFALERLLNFNENDPEVIAFVKEYFEKIKNLHRYFYTYRDPHQEGLVYIFHPWESGRDNSPLWDSILHSIKFEAHDIPAYKRVDNTLADPSERPSSFDYDCYVYLLELGKKNNYNGIAIGEQSPFLVQDTLINTMLIRSNQSLISIGERLGLDVEEIKAWNEKSITRFNEKLWNEELGVYSSYDMVADCQIKLKEVGSFSPLFALIPDQSRAERMVAEMFDIDNKEDNPVYLCPSFDRDHAEFNPKKYWRGPVWPQMNWLLHYGLKKYHFDEQADRLKDDILALIDKLGFYEYFDPHKNVVSKSIRGYGGDRFSWTAAVFIELMHNQH